MAGAGILQSALLAFQAAYRAFVDALEREIAARRTHAWVWLSASGTETDWAKRLYALGDAICFPDHRLNFLRNGVERRGTSLYGSMFTYGGPHKERFRQVFEEIGTVFYTRPSLGVHGNEGSGRAIKPH